MIGQKVCFFERLGSTNTFMKDHLKDYRDGDMVCAKRQTLGRGRRSNTWVSNPGDLHVSFVIDNKGDLYHLFEVILLVTNTLIKLLENYNIDASIKYPNDIVVGKKKIGGILIERIIGERDAFIVGVGLNVITTEFGELSKIATSIKLENNTEIDYRDVLFEFIKSFNTILTQKSCNLYETYRKHSVVLKKEIMVEGKPYFVKDINLDGKLVLMHNGVETLKSMSEVTLKELYE